MTVDNVTQILNKIPKDKWEKVMGGGGLGVGLDIPLPLLWEIQRRYMYSTQTDTEKNHACADYYVNCYPEAEWGHLTRGLYLNNEFAAARESKTFMSTGKYCTISYSYAQIEYHQGCSLVISLLPRNPPGSHCQV